jgi:Protein of unknown function (DUF2735)
MSEDIQRKSAQIFQFPAGGRATLAARRAARERSVDFIPARVANVACASSWYHEDAVREAEQAPKR